MNQSTIIIIALSLLVMGWFFYRVYQLKNIQTIPDSDKLIHLTDANFMHQTKSGMVLVDFWAPWCGPCKMMAPVLNDVANDTTHNVKIAKIDVDQNPQTAQKYNVRSIPTLILFKDGKEYKRFVGIKNKSFLLQELKK